MADGTITVSIHLDGPRETSRARPAEWEQWDDIQRNRFIRKMKDDLLDSTVDFYIEGVEDWELEV